MVGAFFYAQNCKRVEFMKKKFEKMLSEKY
nr:MAG TPA: hypothetical protein [Bacteriophage sp.]